MIRVFFVGTAPTANSLYTQLKKRLDAPFIFYRGVEEGVQYGPSHHFIKNFDVASYHAYPEQQYLEFCDPQDLVIVFTASDVYLLNAFATVSHLSSDEIGKAYGMFAFKNNIPDPTESDMIQYATFNGLLSAQRMVIPLDDVCQKMPAWYQKTKEMEEVTYNTATELYTKMPDKVRIEIMRGQEYYMTYRDVYSMFDESFLVESKLCHVEIGATNADPVDNPEFEHICEYFAKYLVPFSVVTSGTQHTEAWWTEFAQRIDPYVHTLFFEQDSIGYQAFCKIGHAELRTNTTSIPSGTAFKEEVPVTPPIQLESLITRPQTPTYIEQKIHTGALVWCRAKIENRFYVDVSGNVFPCVWTGAESVGAYIPFPYDWDENNAKKHQLRDILCNKFFTTYMNHSLKFSPNEICRSHCGR